MGIFDGKNKNGMYEVFLTTAGPVGDIPGGAGVKVCADTSRRAVVIKTMANVERVLPCEKITKAISTTSAEIEKQSKSIAGRAVIGGVLLGPVGAIVGGMTGFGTKDKKKIQSYVIINYTSGGEEKVAAFTSVTVGDPRNGKLVKAINDMAGVNPIPATAEL